MLCKAGRLLSRGSQRCHGPPLPPSLPPSTHTPVGRPLGRLTSLAIRVALGDLMGGVIVEALLTSIMPVVSHN